MDLFFRVSVPGNSIDLKNKQSAIASLFDEDAVVAIMSKLPEGYQQELSFETPAQVSKEESKKTLSIKKIVKSSKAVGKYADNKVSLQRCLDFNSVRISSNLQQREVATIIGLQEYEISDIESGKRFISDIQLKDYKNRMTSYSHSK